MKFVFWISVILTCTYTCACFSWNFTSDLEILDKLLKNYDRRATPTNNYGTPTEVSIEMYLRSFGSINPATMVRHVRDYTAFGSDYEVDLYLRQSWVDERLHVDNLTHELDLSDPQLVLAIWKPEVYFPNAKQANFQYVTIPNVLVRINPGGNILYMLRLKLTFSCMLNLAKYPLDRQICSIELSSFARTTRELKINWASQNPVRVTKGLKMPQFELMEIISTHCKETLNMGDYSCLRAEFILERSIGYHLVQSYLPTTMIVIVSWVSFWLENDASPARVTLGVTTLLTISSESTGIRSNLPPVSYLKALDVWMGTCTTFVFAALIEFTIVNYLFLKKEISSKKYGDIRHRVPKTNKWLITNAGDHSFNEKLKSTTDARSGEVDMRIVTSSYMWGKLLAKKIDCTCRVAFPLAYLLFNVLYWTYYTM